MNTENTDNSSAEPKRVETLPYERPMVTDHGSLTELTLASAGNFTDGGGFGGGGS